MENIINNEELFGKSALDELTNANLPEIGRASCRERV